MVPMPKRTLLSLAAAASLAPVVASCGSSSATVYMALDNDGARKRSTFYTDTESIVCVAEVPAPKAGITVSAVIRQTSPDHRVDNVLGVGEQVPQKQTAGTSVPKVSFALVKSLAGNTGQDDSTPWPVGQFQCEVSVDGTLKGIAAFEIVMPDCPLYPVATGILCKGFYPVGASCPAQDQSIKCKCDDSGYWVCAA
jgi:hypothetical protein